MSKPMTVLEWTNLPADGKEYPDHGVDRLKHIRRPTGSRAAIMRYWLAGTLTKDTLDLVGKDPGEILRNLRIQAREANCRIAEGGDPHGEKLAAKKAARTAAATPANDLVETVVERFMTHCAARQMKEKTAKEVGRILRKEIVGPWRGQRLSSIGKAEVHALLDDIFDRPAPVVANRTRSWGSRLCSWSIERDIISVNPFAAVKRPALETARDRILSDDELAAVWHAADAQDQPYAAFVKLLLITGARRNEVANMTWREIDFVARVWVLPKARAKNDREHTIPLSDGAVEILKSLPRIGDSDLVFTLNGRNSIAGFYLVKERLDALMPRDTAPWVLHDLRRTVASGCARLGIAPHVVEAILNHASGEIRGVAAVYNKYRYEPEKRAALETWGRFVETLVSGEPAGNVVRLKG